MKRMNLMTAYDSRPVYFESLYFQTDSWLRNVAKNIFF